MGYLQTIITQFFQHQTTPEISERVHERIANAEAKEIDETLLELWNQIPTISHDQDDTDSAWSEIEQRINSTTNPSTTICRSSYLNKIGKFICAASLIGGTYFVWQHVYTQQKAGPTRLVEHYVGRGKNETIFLPDSSKVYLNSGSTLIHTNQLGKHEREVFLIGEAYFEIHKDTEHPFVVKTHGLSLEVLGTQFNIASYPESDRIVTTLTEGKVKVIVDNIADSLFLLPGDQLIYWPKYGSIQKQTLGMIDANMWRKHDLYFDNCTLNESFAMLERRFNISIQTDAVFNFENRLNVHFHRNESLKQVLDVIIGLVPGLYYTIQGQTVHISMKENKLQNINKSEKN